MSQMNIDDSAAEKVARGNRVRKARMKASRNRRRNGKYGRHDERRENVPSRRRVRMKAHRDEARQELQEIVIIDGVTCTREAHLASTLR